jgi:hypothetical protein
MKLTTGRTKLFKAAQVLAQRWDQVRPGWNDAVRRDFEKEFLEPLADQTRDVLRGIDRLADVLEEVYKDCD